MLGLRMVCIFTHNSPTGGCAGFLQRHGAISAEESMYWAWCACLDDGPCCCSDLHPSLPTPLQATLVHTGKGETLYHLFIFSLTHYFYFSCRQAIAKIPTHQHNHRCKLSCSQSAEKKAAQPWLSAVSDTHILQKDRKEKKGTDSF